jgi:hypothetical protein
MGKGVVFLLSVQLFLDRVTGGLTYSRNVSWIALTDFSPVSGYISGAMISSPPLHLDNVTL